MTDDTEFPRDEADRAWLGALPRESAPNPAAEEQLAGALRAEGFFAPRRRAVPAVLQLAAAVLLFAAGALAGVRYARRNALETMLERQSLSPAQAVLLVQRAGSAYVRATQRVAAAAPGDSTAAEVAGQVLLGAAQAVARSNVNRAVAPQLVALLDNQRDGAVPPRPTLIWY